MAVARAIIDVDINTSPAAAALRQLQTQVNAFQTALNRGNVVQGAAAKEYSRSLSDLVNSTRYFTAETVRMRTSAAQLDDTLRKGQGSISQYFNALKKGTAEYAAVTSLAQQRAAALQTQFVATGAAAGGYRDALAIRPIQAFSDATSVANQRIAVQRALFNQATTSMINFGKNTQWAGRQLMVGFTVPLTIFGTLAGKTFMDLEKQAIAFKKVYGDAFTTPEELDANIKAVRELSAEFTKYGIAASDTMEMAAQAAAAGAKNADLIDATTEATRLATLGQMEQTKALEATISLQNAFGLSSDKLSKSINFMNMVENQTVLTLQDMADAIPRVAPVIKGLGGSVEEMAAMLAAMKEGGVSAAQGANALKSGLASLINPTNRAVESLGKMGINLNNIIKSNQGDIMGTVQAFARELGKLDQLSQQQVLENVFGKYQYARLGALFKNIIKDGTQASRVLDMAGMSAQQLAATAEKELGVIAESPATKLTAAIERLKLSLAPVGEMFVRIATPVIEIFTRLLDIFNGLPDSVKKIGAIGTIIVGVLIPAGTMFLGLLMNLVGTLLKFGNIFRVAFQGFVKGGLKGAVTAVSQSLRYMSIQELETAEAAQQLGKAADAVSGTLVEQVGAAGGATRAIDSLAGAYARLALRMEEAAAVSGAFATPGAAMARVGRRGQPPVRVVRRNTGGTIPGAGNKDTVPAMLTPGEFVVNKDATAQNLPLLHAINSGQAQGFNMGGGVAKKGRTFYGRFQSRLGIDPRLLAIGEELDITHQRQVQDAAALGFFIPGQRQRSSTSAGMTLHNAHFGAPRLGTSQAEQLARMRTGNNRVALGVELVRAGVPVTALTDDWATVSRRLNIGANRSENEKMSIAQAINELEFINAKDIIRLGPAMQREMITPEEFYTGLLRQLSLYDPNTQFTDAIFTNARNAALADLGKKVRPKITGLRIPTQVDLREFVGGLQGVDPQTAARLVQDADIARELSNRGFDYITAAERPLIMSGRTGLREETGRSSGYHFAEGIPMFRLGGFVRRFQASHASNYIPFSGQHESLLGPAERALYRISKDGTVKGIKFDLLDSQMLMLDERYNQAMREGVGSGITKDMLSKFRLDIQSTSSEKLFERISGLPASAKTMLKDNLIKELDSFSPPLFDSHLATAYEKAILSTRASITDRKTLGEFDSAIERSRRISQVRVKFDPKSELPQYSTVEDAKKAAAARGTAEPFFYKSKSRKTSVIFVDPETNALHNMTVGSTRNISKSRLQKFYEPRRFGRGGIAGIGSALKAWSTSSRNVRQTPSLLDPIEKLLAISKLPKQTRVGRRTAVGLAKGSEFDPEVADFLLKASPEELARVTSLSMRGPLSTTTGTYAGIDPDISRIMFLRQQHAVGRKRYLDDLKMIKSLEQKIASGRGPVGLYQRQLAERKARVAGYRASAHAIGREIKALAPRGYRILDLSMDLPAGTSAFTSRGSYMGKRLDESEIVLGSGTYPISSIQARNTGGQIFDSTQTSRRVVPGTGNRDTVPAMLTPGEFVINKQATAQNKELLHAINNGMNVGGMIQAYELGGVVDAGNGQYLVEGRDGRTYGPMSRQDAMRRSKQLVSARARRTMGSKGMAGGRSMGMGMGLGAVGGALMMAPMMPGIGENAVASTALSSAGMGVNMLSMLPMMGVGGPATLAIAGIAAAATAAGVALYKWRDNIDSSARQAAEFGANLGGTANALNNVASILGQQTPAQRQAQLQLGLSEQEVKTLTESPEFANIFSSEEGQKFITDLENATSAERFKKLSDYLTYAIASGMMDATTAKTFAKGISAQIGDAVLGSQVATAISGTKTGPKALVDLGNKRIAESQKDTSKVIDQNSVSYEESSKAIGAATQIIQDFANAEALAQEQFAMGAISYEELNSVVTQSRDAQAEYTRVIQDAMQKTSDFGGTMQATKDQLLKAGLVTEEGFAAIEAVATKTVAAGRVGAVGGRGAGMGAVGQATAKVVDKELLGAATSALAAGMSEANVEQITSEISTGKGSAFDIYQKMISQGIAGGAAFEAVGATKTITDMTAAPTIAGVPGGGKGVVESVVTKFTVEGGDPTALASLIASLPAEGTARYDFIIKLSGLDPEQQQQYIGDFQNLANLLGTEFATQFTSSSQYQEALKNGTTEALVRTVEEAANVFGENTQKIIDYAEQTGTSLKQLTEYGKDLAAMPQDLELRLGVDMGDGKEIEKFGPYADLLIKKWPVIQNLNPNLDLSLYTKFLTVDEKGDPLSAIETADRTAKLNKLWKTFENTKDSEVRKKAILELIKLEDGKESTNLGDVSEAYDSLIKRFGKKRIMNLPPDILKKVVDAQIDLKPLKAKLRAMAAELKKLGANSKYLGTGFAMEYSRLQNQIASIRDTIGSDVASAQFSGGGDTTGGGGGGGGGQKSIGEQLQDQLDMLKSVFTSIRALLRGENKNFKNVMAGPFAPEFIEYLKSQGEAGVKMLKQQGKKFLDAYKTFVKIQLQTSKNFMQNLPTMLLNQAKATVGKSKASQKLAGQGFSPDQISFALDSMPEGTLALYETASRRVENISRRKKFGGKSYEDLNKRQQRRVLNQLTKPERQAFTAFEPNGPASQAARVANLATVGTNLETAQNELESFNKFAQLGIDPNLAQSFLEFGVTAEMALNMPKDALENLKKGIQAINVAKKIQEIGMSLRDTVLAAKNVKMVADAGITGELGQELSSLIGTADLTPEKFAEITRAFILTKMQANALKQEIEKLNDALQISVNVAQTQLDAINASNNAKNVEIDKLNDANAILQHSIDLENDKIDAYQKQMKEEQDLYDQRIKALEEIEKANEIIQRQQQGQLNIAQALSRGDIAAAAQATQSLQQDLANNRQQETKDALQRQHEAYVLEMQRKIEGVQKTIDGYQNSIKANNYAIYDIQQSINASKEKQRKLEEDIYKRQLLQSIIQTQTAISTAAMVGDLESVRLLQGQLKTQLSVAGKDQKEQDAFFSSIPGGQGIVASATAAIGAKPEDLVLQGIKKAGIDFSNIITEFKSWFTKITTENPTAQTDLQAVLDKLFTKGKYTIQPDGTIIDKDGNPISGADFVTFLSSASLQLFDFIKPGGPMNTTLTSAADALISSASTVVGIADAATAIYNAFKAAERALQGKIDEANEASRPKGGGKNDEPKKPYFGGRIGRFATGSWVPGTGNTDKVPALLTPGEFVVRKSVAQEFGPLLTALNGDVFPKMSGGANIGVNTGAGNTEVQYNYDINVNVAGTNASPDEIANAVMGRIKMMEDRKIRSYKY